MIERLADVDIVISSTESPEAIIWARDIREVLKRRMMEQLDQLFTEVQKEELEQLFGACCVRATFRIIITRIAGGLLFWSPHALNRLKPII